MARIDRRRKTMAAAAAATLAAATLAGSAGSTVQTVTCPNGLAWAGTCWSWKREGGAFARWLSAHGSSPARFRARHPELAARFRQPWPAVPDWQALEHDFHRALRYAAGRFHVSYGWLHACAHSEGGHGPQWVIGTHQDTGPFQFLPGTFEFMSRSAFQTRGAPPAQYRSIRSNVGQTWTAAWAFDSGLSYHWYGAGC